MTHACEWTGRYPAELHVDVPFEERDYLNFLPKQDSVFHDFISMGFNVYVVLVENLTTAPTTTNGKITAFAQGYDSFRPNWSFMESKVVLSSQAISMTLSLSRVRCITYSYR